jgi:chemotaxis protein MotB
MQENGQNIARQFVYFYCWNDGIILSDGQNTYYYNDTYTDRYGNQLSGNLSYEDAQKLENMGTDKLEQIVKTKDELLGELVKAFSDAGISVTINPETGEVTMDAAVLFPVGEYAVSAEGQALMQRFIQVYTGVVFDEKYSGFISKIMVEGHTDSTGNYDSNLTLSQNRANSVKALCLEYGKDNAQLAQMLQAVGYSSDRLIFDASGKEDQAASRRVCFRFIINLDG